MPTPTLITELSTTAAANSPAGSDSPSTLDDIQRAHASFIAQLRDADALKLNASAVSAFGLTLIDDASAAAARATLGAAASGANTDITSLGAVTGVTATLADNTTKLATTAFVIANAPAVADASETVKGKVELATAAETQLGTDTTRAITPAGLAATVMGFGNQTWQAVTRLPATTYTNTTGRPIQLVWNINGSGASCSATVVISGSVSVVLATASSGFGPSADCGFIVIPNGATYIVTESGVSTRTVYELR